MSDSTKSMLSGIYEMGKSVREYIDQNGMSFTGLSDTPDGYETGLFLQSTDAGTKWSNVNDLIGGIDMDLSSYCSYLHLQSNTFAGDPAISDSSIYNWNILTNVENSIANARPDYGTTNFFFQGQERIFLNYDEEFSFLHNNSVEDYTVQYWINSSSSNRVSPIFSSAGENSDIGIRNYLGSDNKLYYEIRDGSSSSLSLASTTVLSSDIWYHVAITKENDAFNLYINGSGQDSKNGSNYPTADSSFSPSVGAGNFGSFADSSNFSHQLVFFEGTMQDFRIDQSLYDTGLFPPNELINTSCGINSSTSMSFHELKDTPATYKNSENRFLRINSAGNGVEFAEISISNASANVQYQHLLLNSDFQQSNARLDDFTVAGLSLSKAYRVSTNLFFSGINPGQGRVNFYNGDHKLFSLYHEGSSTTKSTSMLFSAQDSNFTVSGIGFSSNFMIKGSPEDSFVQLEEQPDLQVEIGEVTQPAPDDDGVIGDYVLSVDEVISYVTTATTTGNAVEFYNETGSDTTILSINYIELEAFVSNDNAGEDLKSQF